MASRRDSAERRGSLAGRGGGEDCELERGRGPGLGLKKELIVACPRRGGAPDAKDDEDDDDDDGGGAIVPRQLTCLVMVQDQDGPKSQERACHSAGQCCSFPSGCCPPHRHTLNARLAASLVSLLTRARKNTHTHRHTRCRRTKEPESKSCS